MRSYFSRTDDQDTLADTLTRLLAKVASPERVREAEAAGFDQTTWNALCDLGLIEAAASGDASLADLGVAAAQCGRFLAPVPFAEAVTAARVLRHAREQLTVFAP